MPMTPIPPLDRLSQTFKNDLDLLFASRIPLFTQEANAMEASMGAFAAGGAYAIMYTWNPQTNIGSGLAGIATAQAANSQVSSTSLFIDKVGVGGVNAAGMLASAFGSPQASNVKGSLRVQKVGDPTKWLTYDITVMNDTPATYASMTCVCTGSSSTNPFIVGDPVMVYLQRNGDKGDAGIPKSAKFSDRQAPGTAGGSGTAASFGHIRKLNTVEWNTIGSAAALGGSYGDSVFVLQPGTYGLTGRAPGLQCGGHKAAIYNESDATWFIMGSSAFSSTTGGHSDSTLSGYFTLTAAKAFTVRHYLASNGTAGTSTLGAAVNGGQIETYTEITITKYA
jgi:hypothetical protein